MTMASKTVSSRLGEIVGASHLLTDPAQLAIYEIDGKIPAAAARPASSEEAAEVVKFAAAEKLAIVATGARTKLGIGMPPRQYDLALDVTRLDRIASYDPGDLTLSVEAGCSLKKLLDAVWEHHQALPLTVPFISQATVGGTIASGVDTPLRQFYGTARDYVLGMEFITGEGVLAKSGGRVVKNVTGYDLHKLMIGALGTLGIITKINFRTFPLPAVSHGFVATFETAGRALELRHRIAQSPLTPMTLEILSPRVAEMFSSDVAARIESNELPANVLSKTHWTLAAAFSGNEKVLARCANDLSRMAEAVGAKNVAVLGVEQRPGMWGRLREAIPIALASSPATTIVKMSVLPTQMNQLLDEAGRIAEINALPWAAVAHGLGVIYFALLPNARDENSQRQIIQTTDEILRAVAGLGGNGSIPWCPGEWKTKLKVWGLERPDSAQMRKLKRVFDPSGILSPGRFVGGL